MCREIRERFYFMSLANWMTLKVQPRRVRSPFTFWLAARATIFDTLRERGPELGPDVSPLVSIHPHVH